MRKQRIILTPLLKDSWRLVSNMIGQRTISFADYENILGQAALEKGVRANFLKENFQKAGLVSIKDNEVHFDSDTIEDSIVGLSLLKSAGPAQRFSEIQGQALLDWLWRAERMGFSFSQATFNWNIEERLKRTTIEPMPILRVSEPEQIAAGFASEKQNDDYRRYLAVAGILPVHFPDREIVMQKLAEDPQLVSFLGFFADMASKIEVLWIYLREIGFDWSFAYLRKIVQGIPSHLRRYLGSYTLFGKRSYPTLQWGFSLPEGLNPVRVKDLIKEELESDLLPFFMDDEALGFEQMAKMIQESENDFLLEILKELKQEFERTSLLVIPGFQDKVAGWSKPLPDFLEKVVISRVLKEKRLVVALDPGLGKTVIGWALAALIPGTVLILVPADLVRDWLAKASQYFQRFPQDVLVVSSVGSRVSLKLQEEIKKARVAITTPGLIINRQDPDTEPLSDFGKILVEKQFQALVVDEAHEYRNLKTKSSQALLALERQMEGLDIVTLLTATPHHREPADAAILAALCLPQEFSNPLAYEAVLRSSPEEARLGFIKKKVIFGDVNRLGTLPAVDWSNFDNPCLLEPKPAHQAVYDYVLGLKGMSGGVKVHLLRQVALNPNLVKDEQGLGKEITLEDKQGRTRKSLRFPMSQAQIKREVVEALRIYQESGSDLAGFTPNWLREAGFENLFLTSFLNYRNWGEMLAECGTQEARTLADLKPVVVSSKYEEIVCLARQALIEGKGVVVAGAFLRKGFIERSEDLAEDDEVDFRAYTSLVSLLEQEFGPIVLAIDGEEPLAIRRRMREEWHSNPKWKICVITGRSSGRGIELSVSSEKGIKGIVFIIVDLPYVPGAAKQLLTRVIRPGQSVPVKIMLLEFPGLIDEGVRLHNQTLQEIVDLMNRGLELTGDDRAIVAKPHLGVLTKFMDPPGAQALTYYYNSMRMNSSSDNHCFLNKGEVIKNGKKVLLGFIPGEYLAEIQVRHQKAGLPKLVAQFRREILEKFLSAKTAKILNVGCGALVLESMAGSSFQFTSLDLCQAMLSKDKEVLAGLEPPSLVQADTVRLPFKETSFDAVVADFVLDTVRLEDRLLTIKGLHEVVKRGGYFFFSLTVKGTMQTEHFQVWVAGLQEMGWEIKPEFSGLAEGRLENGRPLVNFWSFVCQKVSEETKEVNPCLFRLIFEETGRELVEGKLTAEQNIPISEDWRYRKADEMVILDICQNTVKARLKLRKEV